VRLDFSAIRVGSEWTRPDLAKLWMYKGYQAFAKGAFCPSSDNKIVLFVTRDKQLGSTQYKDALLNEVLHWEGPKDHAVDDRIMAAEENGDQIHLFYRPRHHMPFTYLGLVRLARSYSRDRDPSEFTFQLQSESQMFASSQTHPAASRPTVGANEKKQPSDPHTHQSQGFHLR
jgi:putative restriction endonuclease